MNDKGEILRTEILDRLYQPSKLVQPKEMGAFYATDIPAAITREYGEIQKGGFYGKVHEEKGKAAEIANERARHFGRD